MAGDILGQGPLLAPEQMVVIDSDQLDFETSPTFEASPSPEATKPFAAN